MSSLIDLGTVDGDPPEGHISSDIEIHSCIWIDIFMAGCGLVERLIICFLLLGYKHSLRQRALEGPFSCHGLGFTFCLDIVERLHKSQQSSSLGNRVISRVIVVNRLPMVLSHLMRLANQCWELNEYACHAGMEVAVRYISVPIDLQNVVQVKIQSNSESDTADSVL